ncbi:MAG: hypothetical protein V3W52_17205 [Syntrophobacteria bacterium]
MSKGFLAKVAPFAGMLLRATPLAPLAPLIGTLSGSNPNDLTVETAQQAYVSLADDMRQQVDQQADSIQMEKEHTEQLRILNEADIAGNSTRPQVVLLYAWVTAGTIALFILFMFHVTWGLSGEELTDVIKSLSEMWMLIAGVLGVLASPILKYFNVRTKDKANRLTAMTGQAFPSILSSIASRIMR